jgi:lipopolysaccharide/colanic/teichoic acid biosynthesis glycosyltransferase
MKNFDKTVKRSFDIIFALFGLLFLFPVIFLSYIISSFETSSNGLFIQQRVGKGGRLFNVFKIKTMKIVDGISTVITSSKDVRITKSGFFFRKTKIDELPQLWNVLIGQMSFVGPRPDVPGYADRLQGKDRVILSVRPGITGPAQLAYRGEEDILATQNDPVKYNDEVIWPNKVKINLDYVDKHSFFKDLYYIWKTITGGNVKY